MKLPTRTMKCGLVEGYRIVHCRVMKLLWSGGDLRLSVMQTLQINYVVESSRIVRRNCFYQARLLKVKECAGYFEMSMYLIPFAPPTRI